MEQIKLRSRQPSLKSWLDYNALFVILLAGLGAASVAAFEPVTTAAAVIAEGGPPQQLIGQALPLTLLFTSAVAVLISLRFRPDWLGFTAALIFSFVVVLLLGSIFRRWAW